MNLHDQRDDILDLSLRHILRNWVARETPPSDTREKLLNAAIRQEVSTAPRKSARYGFGGWSLQFHNHMNELSFQLADRYKLDSVYALKPILIS